MCIASYLKKRFTPDIKNNADFGHNVSVSEDYIALGSYYNNVRLSAAQGSAYIYKRTGGTWALIRKVDNGCGQSNGLFGGGAGISGYI